MDNLQIRFVFDRKHKATETKRGLLQIEVRVQKTSQKVFISTGIYLLKNQFSDRNGFTCRNYNNAALFMGKATRIFRTIEAFALSDKCKRLADVKNWNKSEADLHSFTEFMWAELRRRNPTAATLEHHAVLIRQVEAFGKIKTFADLNYENISDFDGHLRRTIHSLATLHKRHSTLHGYVRQAINRELITKDPYAFFKIPPSKSKKPTFLEDFEIDKIVAYQPTVEKLEHVRDMFVFQIFTGLAFVDMYQFNRDCIHIIEGQKIIRSNRQKTDVSFVTLLLPEAERILEKYDYRLPVMTNQKYNDYLKLLGAGAGITKTLTSHVGRHTFATYLINKDIPIESVSKAMGHSSIKMTEHYAKLLGRKVIKDMSALL